MLSSYEIKQSAIRNTNMDDTLTEFAVILHLFQYTHSGHVINDGRIYKSNRDIITVNEWCTQGYKY